MNNKAQIYTYFQQSQMEDYLQLTTNINHPPKKTLCGGWCCVTARGLIDSSVRISVDFDECEMPKKANNYITINYKVHLSSASVSSPVVAGHDKKQASERYLL